MPRRLTNEDIKGIDWRVSHHHPLHLLVALAAACGIACAQEQASPAAAESESEVIAEPIPPSVVATAVESVAKLGEELVLGRYHLAIERMYPPWKKRYADRIGGMDKLEKQLASVPAHMIQKGISMISFKPHGQPSAYEVALGKKIVNEGNRNIERMVFTKWLVLVPTITQYRILEKGNPRPIVHEITSFQVAISDKGKNDWTFIAGAELKPGDLRGIFITLPQDMKLPPVADRVVR